MTQSYEPDPRYRQPLNLPQPYDPQQVAPKSAGIALLLSLIVPGLGTMYAGEVPWESSSS